MVVQFPGIRVKKRVTWQSQSTRLVKKINLAPLFYSESGSEYMFIQYSTEFFDFQRQDLLLHLSNSTSATSLSPSIGNRNLFTFVLAKLLYFSCTVYYGTGTKP